MTGTLFLVVGPSGVGKDTLLDGAREQLSASRWFRFLRRVITRPEEAGGEDHIAATDEEFDDILSVGGFLHHWEAHGLRYGIPADALDDLGRGVNVVLNTSRNELEAFQEKVSNVVVVYISASPEVVEKRLRARARETDEEIARRLARIVERPTAFDGALELLNDSTVERGVEKLIDVIAGSCDLRAEATELQISFGSKPLCLFHRGNPIAARLLAGSERVSISANGKSIVAELGWTDEIAALPVDKCAVSGAVFDALDILDGDAVDVERSPTPQSRAILQKKVRGGQLNAEEIHGFVDDLVNGRYSSPEIAGFLVSAANNLNAEEIIALTQARAAYAHRQDWGADIVVDKHSMGGIPGNRITPIVIPIIAAFGLTMPKTSSRAITSAAGTADMMEVLTRVDLTPEEMRKVVGETGACIAWNGRLTHSPVDDVMNSINRPLGLASALLDVSSIMSKKLAAGSTHVLIDLPIGPQAKTKSMAEGENLKSIFETVGEGIGLKVQVNLTDGTKPIGFGVGPILEAIDVFSVLRNDPDAPRDLLEKSLQYAARILEWTGSVAEGQGDRAARELIESGKALEKFQEIVDRQGGRDTEMRAGSFTWEVTADRAGQIDEMDIRTVSAIARAAGAPLDTAAGVRVLANVGSELDRGQPVLRVFSSSRDGLADARAVLEKAPPVIRRWAD